MTCSHCTHLGAGSCSKTGRPAHKDDGACFLVELDFDLKSRQYAEHFIANDDSTIIQERKWGKR